MSSYYREDFFEGLMGLNVTVMLVLTTLFLRDVFEGRTFYFINIHYISVSTNLPPTAYIKMIDCWLIFSLLKPFVDILVQTYRQTITEDSGDEIGARKVWTKKEKRKIGSQLCQTFLRVIYPIFFIVFIVLFWLAGLVHYIIL